MKTINPNAIIDPAAWPAAGANAVKNGAPASAMFMLGADAQQAQCLLAYPSVSVAFPSLPTSSDYAEIQIMAPPFANKMQIGAIGYLSGGMTGLGFVTVVNVTSGVSGTTSYVINLNPSDPSDAAANELVHKWEITWGAGGDDGQLMDIAESSSLGIPALQELRLSVNHNNVECRGLIFRFTRNTSTLS